ncbi:hypothetical protein WUBG_03475 [Wuchereria bancrofti]|uniref:Uncharacterized protein n=1 Tax=Wuchereria bancrofti TaxID=6293 RepID=J9ETX3_WUCBA|nr:hypothetical protein WUBG_03475 [Wuchereria bancrofti]
MKQKNKFACIRNYVKIYIHFINSYPCQQYFCISSSSSNQPTNQPTNQPINQPTNEPTNRPTDRPIDRPTDPSTNPLKANPSTLMTTKGCLILSTPSCYCSS